VQEVNQIFDLFEGRGIREHGGESVTHLEHARSSNSAPSGPVRGAGLARRRRPAPRRGPPTRRSDRGPAGAGLAHELLGARFIAPAFGRPIARVIALHVKAKRYLCAVEPSYHERLSPASARSLTRQGGVLSLEEVREFERQPYHREAVRLRRWDEYGKSVGRAIPGLESYRQRLEAARVLATASD
jgi:predicted HD phosphohydrolase